MNQQQTTEAIRLIFSNAPYWFGAPPLKYLDKMLDGRKRFREAVAAHIAIPAPIIAATAGDAARLLCVFGHYDRAKTLIPSELHRLADAAAFCGTQSRELLAPMFRKPKRSQPKWESRYAHRRAIEQMSRLLRAAELTDGTVTAEEIRGVLAPWL